MDIQQAQALKREARPLLNAIVVDEELAAAEAANAQAARATAAATGDVLMDFNTSSPRWFSLGIGTTEDPDNYTLAIRIRTGKPIRDLENRIRRELAGKVNQKDLNIRHTGPVYAIRRETAHIPRNGTLKIGSSVSMKGFRGGTLGFFAKTRDAGEQGFVSANHVIGRQDRAQPNELIIHPADGNGTSGTVGLFSRFVSLAGGGDKTVDCAFATLAEGVAVDRKALPNGQALKGVAVFGESPNVRRAGFMMDETFGRVTAFDQDNVKVISYGVHLGGIVRFENQIEIESTMDDRGFASPGDSGALVYNDNLHAVGLLFATTLRGGRNNLGLSYANRIDAVLDALNVDLMTN